MRKQNWWIIVYPEGSPRPKCIKLSYLKVLILGIVFGIIFVGSIVLVSIYGKVYVSALRVHALERSNARLKERLRKLYSIEKELTKITEKTDKLALMLGLKESETVEYEKEDEGVILKANSIGSLEALIHMAKKENIPIKKTEVGNVTKEDVIESSLIEDKKKRIIFSFNSKILEDAKELAKKLNVKIFSDNIIYKLFEDYKKWLEELKEKEIQEKLASIGRPVKLRVLKGCIFRSSKPCIVGVEIISGKLIPGVKLAKDNKFIGKVKEIQKEGENIQEANVNERVAISMEEPTAKKDFFEDDILVSYLSENEIRILKELKSRLSESEIQLLEELEKKVS